MYRIKNTDTVFLNQAEKEEVFNNDVSLIQLIPVESEADVPTAKYCFKYTIGKDILSY